MSDNVKCKGEKVTGNYFDNYNFISIAVSYNFSELIKGRNE